MNRGCPSCFLATETYNASNQNITGGLYGYDDNGNSTSVTTPNTNPPQTRTYAWDYEDRLTSATLPSGAVVSFKYDPFGRRIQKSSASGTKNYVYDGAAILEELDAAGAVTSRYVHGPGVDEPWVLERATSRYFYTADVMGSITGVLDATGSKIESNRYQANGENTFTSALVQPFGYTGREYDSETGLYYFRARYMDPKWGRFISEDPIRFEGGMNFYVYVGNNPVTYTDPSGKDVAIIENGPTRSNPAGHTAIAVTGAGVYSFGNSTPLGSSLRKYLLREKPRRNTKVYVIKTTPEQDAAILAILKDGYGSQGFSKVWKWVPTVLQDNCSLRVNSALDAINLRQSATSSLNGTPILPGSAGEVALANGAAVLEVPKGTTIILPPGLEQFEPRPIQ